TLGSPDRSTKVRIFYFEELGSISSVEIIDTAVDVNKLLMSLNKSVEILDIDDDVNKQGLASDAV
ncbi:hypothetical protein J6590_084920, partial [Homalodisca vitripennis]